MATTDTTTQHSSGEAFAGLRRYQFAELTTFRKDGRAVSTTVWFAPHQGKLYVMAPSTTGKLKRIRHNNRVLLAPCSRFGRVLGTSIELHASILPANSATIADQALAHKYGFLYRVFAFFLKLRKIGCTFIEIA